MPQLYGVRNLGNTDDWIPIVGQQNWVPGHSAYELAHRWQGCNAFPPTINAVFANAGAPFAGMVSKYGIVELPTFLDTFKGPSRTDIMVHLPY